MISRLIDFPRISAATAWAPRVDLHRSARAWICKVDLAGVREGDVRIELTDRALYIRGVRRDQRLEEGARHYLLEIAYSRFERIVELPEALPGAALVTSYRDGILTIRVEAGVEAS